MLQMATAKYLASVGGKVGKSVAARTAKVSKRGRITTGLRSAQAKLLRGVRKTKGKSKRTRPGQSQTIYGGLEVFKGTAKRPTRRSSIISAATRTGTRRAITGGAIVGAAGATAYGVRRRRKRSR